MQRVSTQVFLWVAPFISPILMLTYRAGGLKLYALCGAALFLMIARAVWILAAGSANTPSANRRDALLPGVLLVASLGLGPIGLLLYFVLRWSLRREFLLGIKHG